MVLPSSSTTDVGYGMQVMCWFNILGE